MSSRLISGNRWVESISSSIITRNESFKARFADLRTAYGATSTIFTEYLRAAGMEPSQRLATALLYGIKTDTLFLERGTKLADLSAFNFLYPLANKAMITRIERPALPREDLEAMGRAFSHCKSKTASR